MSLLQVQINDVLMSALRNRSERYGVPVASLVKMALGKIFLDEDEDDYLPGNVFNADRDNNGKGIPAKELLK